MSCVVSDRAMTHGPPIIVCVDDDHSLRALCWLNLWFQGYRCMPCESAEAALEAVRLLPVALAILDFEMPGMTGSDLAKSFRTLRASQGS
jgi:DNA-binding response OmpR family regulator